jgi:hypothetical protein
MRRAGATRRFFVSQHSSAGFTRPTMIYWRTTTQSLHTEGGAQEKQLAHPIKPIRPYRVQNARGVTHRGKPQYHPKRCARKTTCTPYKDQGLIRIKQMLYQSCRAGPREQC